ncbi:hypothetical protein [Halalkalibaculum sp. DA384]|uniref:hypothetical protein n=1 Tax=Halalkalibaculum sp. DA384 TaxID=3373606 RepID=UPI0037546533
MNLFSLVGLLFLVNITPQETDTTSQQLPPNTINVYVDCRGCSESYVQNEINFVQFVRDMTDADVHLLVTRQWTGSGGREYQIRYIGQRKFEGQEQLLTYQSYQSDTQDIRRRGLVKKIKVGLLPYLRQTSIIQELSITYDGTLDSSPQQQDDKWNRWIFEVGMDSFFDGEDTRSRINIWGEISASRITEQWKTDFEFDKDFRRRSFTDEDTTETYLTESNRYRGIVAKSLNSHWSLGLFTEATTSTRNNYDLRIGGSPAIEYNIFPYSEFTERELSLRYVLMTTYNNYDKVTVYGEWEELLIQNRFSANMEFTQPWGEIEGDLELYAYMRDWSKNRAVFDLEFDFQITRGLSMNLSGRYSLVNDQLSIPAEEISDEEQLLNLKEPPTSFYYNASIGFEYTFGSIYNSVVNPRF